MAVIDTLVKIIVALAVVAFVGYPLLKGRWDEEPEPVLSDESEELYRRKESIYSALKELEFDYKTGKLSEQDYRELDARYKAEALEILEAIDEAEKPQPKASRTKKPRAAASAPARRSSPAGAAASTAPAGSSGSVACGSCGRVNPAGARFCASCGERFDARPPAGTPKEPEDALALICDSCGAEIASGHRFCGSCGIQVQA